MAATLFQHWNPVLRLKSSLRIVPCIITFKPGANGRNIVGQQLPTLFDVTCWIRLHRCVLLGVDAQSLKPVKLLATCKRTQQLPTMSVQHCWGSCWPTMLRPFAPGLRLRSHRCRSNFQPVEKFDRALRFTWNRSIFSRCSHGTVEPGWILTFVRFYHLPMRKMASPSWVTTHPCNRVFTVQKVSRTRC